jgi:hypothetical protein
MSSPSGTTRSHTDSRARRRAVTTIDIIIIAT